MPLDLNGTSHTKSRALAKWVAESAQLTQPDRIVWCDGSEAERQRLTEQAVREGVLIPLNHDKRPNCYLHRSNPNDVARTEHLTFVCTPTKDEAGPTNNWSDPAETYAKLRGWFDGSMRGRTMYVDSVRDGAARLAAVEGRRRNHRQHLRRAQHAHHDADGRGRARTARRLRRLQSRDFIARSI